MTEKYRCYVLGCTDPDVWARVGRYHPTFGPVVTCPAHDPARFGLDCSPAPAFGALYPQTDGAGRQGIELSDIFGPSSLLTADTQPGARGTAQPDTPDVDVDGGARVPRRPAPQPLSPAGARASVDW